MKKYDKSNYLMYLIKRYWKLVLIIILVLYLLTKIKVQ